MDSVLSEWTSAPDDKRAYRQRRWRTENRRMSWAFRFAAPRQTLAGQHHPRSLVAQPAVRLLVNGLGAVPSDLYPIRVVRIQAERANDLGVANIKMVFVRE